MTKDFERWNQLKKKVHASEIDRDFFFHKREVWWCAIGANIGVETDGKHQSFERPVIIIHKFNKEMFWGVPFTSNKRVGEYYMEITHEQGTSWAILSQLRTWSSKRLLRRIGKIPENDFAAIIHRIRDFIEIETPR